MPRMGRVVLPDYPHHIVQRGHNRQVIFVQAEDCLVVNNKSVRFFPFTAWLATMSASLTRQIALGAFFCAAPCGLQINFAVSWFGLH